MIVGYIGRNTPSKPDRTSVLMALGGQVSPGGDFIYLPGDQLPAMLAHLAHEWNPVTREPEWFIAR